MSTVTSSGLHPILEDFCAQFEKNFPQATGEEHSGEVTIKQKNYCLSGNYYVCNSTIKLDIEEQISIDRSLLAGRVVKLKAPQMSFEGTKDKPVQIVGLEGVAIQATAAAKVKNLEIYLLKGASFSYSAKDFSEFENVRVVRLELKGRRSLSDHHGGLENPFRLPNLFREGREKTPRDLRDVSSG